MMRRLLFLSILMVSFASSYRGQSVEATPIEDQVAAQKIWLLSDLQALDAKTAKLEKRVAMALAKAEIADAAWKLDEEWSKKLLREAYELTLPEEKALSKFKELPAGAQPAPPTPELRARWSVRNRVLNIARRDESFANQLIEEVSKRLGRYELHLRYAELADFAIEAGDSKNASKYILQAVEADPTQSAVPFSILRLAARDRAAADQLTIQYLERLRATPTAFLGQSAGRTIFNLNLLIFSPKTELGAGGQPVPPPGPAVMRAYASYVVEAIAQRERVEPGTIKRSRLFLLTAWVPIKKYAPELAGDFLELEKLSRKPGDDASLPRESHLEKYRERREENVRRNLDSDDPDHTAINSLIGEGDFARARKLIDRLEDGAQKTQLTEKVNLREAQSLAAKGDVGGAQLLAERLTKTVSILQVYPDLIRKCVAKKDDACASNLVYQAARQLKRADASRPLTPAGIPASATASSREFDPVVSGLGKLAKIIFPINEALGWEVMVEMVAAANTSELDTGQGRVGLDADTFSLAAAKNEQRARQLAGDLKDPLRQVVSLAAIYKWKAAVLTSKEQASH